MNAKSNAPAVAAEPPATAVETLRELCECSPLVMWIAAGDGRTVYCNQSWRECLGHDAFVWPGLPDRSETAGLPGRGARRKRLEPPVETVTLDDGERHFLVTRFALPPVDGERYVAAIAVDITEHRRRAEEMERLSITDELTGLYNRRGFLLFADHELKAARRRRARCALMYVDIDHLKRVNDSAGHGAGDRLLREAAAILRGKCRATDVVGRLGGDEFAVLAADVTGGAEALKQGVYQSLARLAPAQGRALGLSLSVGVVTCEWDEAPDLTKMLAAADGQLYEEKTRKAREALGLSPRPPAGEPLLGIPLPGRAPPA